MATESIFRNIFIDNEEDAERFVSALEKAEAIADQYPIGNTVKYKVLETPEEVEAFCRGKKIWKSSRK